MRFMCHLFPVILINIILIDNKNSLRLIQYII